MSRLWETITRRPPMVAPEALRGRDDLVFGFTTTPAPEGWTVLAYGADGRRLGRPLKGLSSPAMTTLIAPLDEITDPGERRRLADAWVAACRRSATNAELLRTFAQATAQVTGG